MTAPDHDHQNGDAEELTTSQENARELSESDISEADAQPDPEFESLLAYLHRSRGFDFTAYKRTTLSRRVRHRMETIGGIETYSEYQDYLEVHPDEFAQLFNTILINVTSFYRDPAAWDFLSERVIPSVLASKAVSGAPVRCWVAGCASGEEPYTLAMVLSEAMGEEYASRVKIYATDLNEGDLSKARQGVYSGRDVQSLPPRLREKYLRPVGQYFSVDPELRRNVVFGRHDLLTDSPISKGDLLLCRNTMMYFNSEAQTRVLERFHFAMLPTGYLFLGKAEMLLTNTDIFTPLDLKRRVFVRVDRTSTPIAPHRSSVSLSMPAAPSDETLREAALQSAPVAQLVVDPLGVLVSLNDRSRTLFGLTPSDVGRPLAELSLSAVALDLPMCVERARHTGLPLMLKEVNVLGGPDPRCFDVQFVPLLDLSGSPLGTSITFAEATLVKRLREDLQHASEERETAHEELQTTNEELQSTVEELETTNEELQSTNEELETMNEELQSTNEELRATNEQLREQGTELLEMGQFWRSVIGSLSSGVIIIDPEFRVVVWNARATDQWGLRPDETEGKNLFSLDFGLPVEQLKAAIRSALGSASSHQSSNAPSPVDAGAQTLRLAATNRRGRAVTCVVTVAPLFSEGNGDRTPRKATPSGVIILIEEATETRP